MRRPFVLLAAVLLTCTPGRRVTAAKLPPVRVDGVYFSRNGKRFIPVGAHWVPARAAMEWPLRWDPAEIEADFAKMHDLGYTLVRFDVLWGFLEPRPGEYSAEAFRQIDELIRLATKYEIYLHPSLFIGGEVGEAFWDVPWRNGRNPHTDPEMIRLETNLAAELGRRYGDEAAIIAWDLTDEPPFWITTGITDAQAASWTHAIAGGIRRHDRLHPIVVGTSGQETSHGPFRSDVLMREKDVDFFSVHPFTIYRPELFPDAMLSERGTYGAAFEVALSSGAGRPAMIHEMGASSAQYAPERIAQYERTSLYSGIGAGSIGINLWCFTDAAPEQRKKLPYLRTPQETEWGMTTWDRKDKPRGREFRRFAKVAAQLELAGIAPASPDAAVIVPEEWSRPFGEVAASARTTIPYVSVEDTVNGPGGGSSRLESANTWLMGSLLSSFVLGRRAGLTVDFPREQTAWETRAPIVILPSPLTSTATPFLTHVHSDFYDRAAAFVSRGGFLYASVAADAAIPSMDTLFGARLVDTNTTSDVMIVVEKHYGDLEPGMTFSFKVPAANARHWGSMIEVSRGDVIARDQDGHPAIVASALGKGKTLLAAYPLESWIAVTPSAFDRKAFKGAPQLVDLLYRSIRKESGHVPLFLSNDPLVEVTTLKGPAAGYAVVVHHGEGKRTVTLSPATDLASLVRLVPDGVPLPVTAPWTIELDAWDGAILAWKARQ